MPRCRPSDFDDVLFPKNWLPKRRRRLPGLTIDETIEFETLDAQPPFDCNGEVAWIFEGEPTSPREKRWLELFKKLR